jgi:PAS domain S-box-containing protein
MVHKDAPIQRKLMAVILLTTSLALVVSCIGFITYEISTLKKNITRSLATRAEIIAANIRTTLELQHPADATEVLNALQKDPRMVSACIYDRNGRLFARYPANAPDGLFPKSPDQCNTAFGPSFLAVCSPVIKDGQTLGTVYLKSNLSALTDRYPGYAVLSSIVFTASLLAAYLLSKLLQRQISQPIHSLAETARIVSNRRDFSVRATKYGNDELGLLTDTFNQMLARIQEQNRVLLQFAAIIESSDDAIISKTLDGIITSWNPGAEKLFGYPAAEAIGQPMLMLIPPERASEEPEILARIARGEFIENFETVRVRKDGTLVDIAASISPIKDATGQVVSISKIARSITERKRAEEKIHQLNLELEQRVVERTAELEAANKELEAFSYSVSHDLRAPLRAVDGFSQAVEEDYGPQLPAEGRRYLRTIREAAQRMGVLIDDLLTFSRLSRQPLNQQKVNNTKLVRDVLEELNFRSQARPVEIRLGELPACEGDAALMKQVWINLLSNALKYTGKCDAAVVEIGCRSEAGENIYFVRDNGAGFNMQYAHKLFGVFQRLHRADEFEGTGVGLAIVQRIIQRHGGRVWAKAALNEGATFYFTVK